MVKKNNLNLYCCLQNNVKLKYCNKRIAQFEFQKEQIKNKQLAEINQITTTAVLNLKVWNQSLRYFIPIMNQSIIENKQRKK